MAVMLLEWVFTSIFLILVVLALRAALGKRVSAGLRYALWAVVLVRLLVPVQLFTSPLAGTWVVSEADTERNVYTVPAPSANLAEPVISLPETGVTPGAVPNFPDAPTMPDAPEPPAAPDLTRAPAWLGWIWLAGSAAVALVLLVSNLRFYWRLRRERVLLEGADCPLRVYAAVNLPSPCLLGIVRPAIYTTPEAAADPDMLRHVLAHEHTHYRHGDHVWSLLRCAALVVHWWNPLVWVSAVLSQRDAELACDEGALKRLGDGERAGYGGTLLALVTAKPRPADLFRCATTMAGDKKSLKERITRIAQAPRRVLWAVVVAVAVTALACVCAFGQAAEPEHKAPNEPEQYDLSFSLNEHGDVSISGTVDGQALGAGTYWHPAYDAEHPITYLALEYPACIEGPVEAWWGSDEHTSVMITTSRMAMASGYWIFTVDFSGEQAAVMEMSQQIPDNLTEPMGDAKLYPESISDRDAVRIARVAAKLLTEAEDYYYSSAGQPLTVGTLQVRLLDVPEKLKGSVKASASETKAPLNNIALVQYWWDSASASESQDIPSPAWLLSVHCEEREFIDSNGWPAVNDEQVREIIAQDEKYYYTIERPGDIRFEAEDAESFTAVYQAIRAYIVKTVLNTEGVEPYGPVAGRTDLNRNGVPEELRVVSIDGGAGQKLEVWEGDSLLYSEEGYFAHAGYNALFLCTLDGEDYLLRYHPTMYQGYCTYNYQLFTLENGRETVARENSVEFDINFGPLMHLSFEPETIAAFVDEINGLLAHSTQLINTDDNLLDTFKKEGRMVDDLWWLDTWEPVFTRDPAKSLLDNLRDFQTAMEEQWHAEEPKVFRMNEGEVKGNDAHVLLRYQDRSTQFDARWESEFQPEEAVNLRVLDLNGDGKDEIVFSLVEGEGTGCLVENLYVFDAETLEQYDTDRLNEMIFNSIESTGDEENFYLRGAGMDETIPKSEAQAKNPYAPMADTLWFEDYIRYTIEDGQVFCWLGCDASGSLINYTGYIKVPINMSPSGAFTCGTAMYVDIKDDGQAMS